MSYEQSFLDQLAEPVVYNRSKDVCVRVRACVCVCVCVRVCVCVLTSMAQLTTDTRREL